MEKKKPQAGDGLRFCEVGMESGLFGGAGAGQEAVVDFEHEGVEAGAVVDRHGGTTSEGGSDGAEWFAAARAFP